MKEKYILIILICFLIIINYNNRKINKKKNKKQQGGNLLEKFNNKTSYFKIKIQTLTEKKLITLEQTVTGPEVKLIKNSNKTHNIPDANIWEIKLNGSNYMIKNTLNQLTLAYSIIEENKNNIDSFKYNNNGYILELVRNKNIFNIYFEDSSENKLGKMYLLIDEKTNKLIAKSEDEINKNIELEKGDFLIEPYKLNLFNNENKIITHYENFVNNFNYEKFNLMFTLHFKHIIIPKIYSYENPNKLTNNTNRYNIYPTNWVAGPNPEPGEGIILKFADGSLDTRYSNLFESKSQRQLLISEPYKKTDIDITTKGKKGIDRNEDIGLWNLEYNPVNKTYNITNVKTGLSILQNVIKNSKKFFSNFMNNKEISLTDNQKKEITLEDFSTEDDNKYNLSFNVTVENETTPVKMYLSTSNWGGILVARKADINKFRKIDKQNNIFIIKTNEEDKRIPEKILIKQKFLDLSDEELNEIIPNTVSMQKNVTIKNKYLKLEDEENSNNINFLRDYINNILYKKYYKKLEFERKNNIMNKLEENLMYLGEKVYATNLIEIFDKIFKKSPDIENIIENIQYIFNIKKYTSPKYYYSNPIGDILTIGNNILNKHNFIIKIHQKMGTGTEKVYILTIGFIGYTNNIEIPLNNIKNIQNNFPSTTNFKLEYEKPYLNILVSYFKKNKTTQKMEEVNGYLNINGEIIEKTDKEQKIGDFRKIHTNINFEIYFPAYINPWFSVGTIDNINVKTSLNQYSMMIKSFLSKDYISNKVIKDVKYNNKNELGNIHMLGSLQNSYNIISGENNNIDFDNKNGLQFKINIKSLDLSKPISNELFDIQGKDETIFFSIKNGNLLITEKDIKYVKNDNTFNQTSEHINTVNTICDIPINFTSNDIILDFVTLQNHYSLTIHNGNKFIDYILGIDLSEIAHNTVINVNDKIELKYKVITSGPFKNILPEVSSDNKKQWIIGNDKKWVRKESIMPTNYFGTKIKNNFYKSNRIQNLYLRISSDTKELTDKLNPQTLLWSDSYNSQSSDWWRLTQQSELDKIKDKIKNKFLKVENTPQSVIYEFNKPINISYLKVNSCNSCDENKYNLEYWDEKEDSYKSLGLEKAINKSISNINQQKQAYKFRFRLKNSTTTSEDITTGGSNETQEIYNILINGIIGRNYPYLNINNKGTGIIKSKNTSPEKNVFINYIRDEYGLWMKVGIIKTIDSMKNTIQTVNNLSVVTNQDVGSNFSADFGELRTSEVRILGANDFENWRETRTIDWIYKVPKTSTGEYKKWKNFFDVSYFGKVSSADYGFKIDGAYDGRGRWINDKLKHIRVSDKSYNNNSLAYNKAGEQIKIGDNKGDHQLYVNGNEDKMDGLYGATSGFGEYDGNKYFYDINYNAEEQPHYTIWTSKSGYFDAGWNKDNWKKQKINFQSAVWILLKIEEKDLEILEGDSLNEVKKNFMENLIQGKSEEIADYEGRVKRKIAERDSKDKQVKYSNGRVNYYRNEQSSAITDYNNKKALWLECRGTISTYKTKIDTYCDWQEKLEAVIHTVNRNMGFTKYKPHNRLNWPSKFWKYRFRYITLPYDHSYINTYGVGYGHGATNNASAINDHWGFHSGEHPKEMVQVSSLGLAGKLNGYDLSYNGWTYKMYDSTDMRHHLERLYKYMYYVLDGSRDARYFGLAYGSTPYMSNRILGWKHPVFDKNNKYNEGWVKYMFSKKNSSKHNRRNGGFIIKILDEGWSNGRAQSYSTNYGTRKLDCTFHWYYSKWEGWNNKRSSSYINYEVPGSQYATLCSTLNSVCRAHKKYPVCFNAYWIPWSDYGIYYSSDWSSGWKSGLNRGLNTAYEFRHRFPYTIYKTAKAYDSLITYINGYGNNIVKNKIFSTSRSNFYNWWKNRRTDFNNASNRKTNATSNYNYWVNTRNGYQNELTLLEEELKELENILTRKKNEQNNFNTEYEKLI